MSRDSGLGGTIWWCNKKCETNLDLYTTYMGVGPKIGVILTTQIIHFNRVFHEINHPFWGPTRNFWKHPHTSPLPKCPVVTKGGFLGRPTVTCFLRHRWTPMGLRTTLQGTERRPGIRKLGTTTRMGWACGSWICESKKTSDPRKKQKHGDVDETSPRICSVGNTSFKHQMVWIFQCRRSFPGCNSV